MTKLTEKQQRFADEYIISGNATQAAIKAGYSKRTAKQIGQENLTKPDLKTYIDKRLEQIKSRKIASQEEVLEYLTSVMRGNEQEQTLINSGEWQEITEIDVGAKDRIKAAELLGKRYALFTDKVDLQTGDIVIKVGDWDADEED
ncbi:terminase small subunit [Enterococcus nangangensis]|uniref:terminase small subunit n=1 Tax=Enterococcus nangangensis TaxID=2559926 RepID=UPI0010F6A1CC|nr:terminase small subunit [Enterococcus nangangensis]